MDTVLTGYGQVNPTTVYSGISKCSSKLKSYTIGTKLKYRPHNKDWYKATVKYNGVWKIGYIHAKDVGEKAPTLRGYGIVDKTTVYAKASKGTKKLKSYKKGSKLKYKPYNANWYVASIIINGKRQTGYIDKSEVGAATNISFVNPRKTYTYNQLGSDIKKLAAAYPDLISYKVVGNSEYGRNLYAVSLGKGEPTTFINGSLHAREWITTSLNMNMIEECAKA